MRRPAAIGLLLVLALAGCGGMKKGGLTPVGNEEATQPPPEKQNVTVEMISIRFQPRTVHVAEGGKVTWVNHDKVAHTVTVGDDLYNSLNSGDINPGKRYEKVFNKPRKIGYRCTIHPNMEGTIYVGDAR